MSTASLIAGPKGDCPNSVGVTFRRMWCITLLPTNTISVTASGAAPISAVASTASSFNALMTARFMIASPSALLSA